MQKVFDLFSSIYSSTAGDSAFLAFEKLGVPIPPGMFKEPEATTFSAALAVERLSEIVNVVLEADGDSVKRSIRTVPAMTEFMLKQAMPVSSNADAMASLGRSRDPAEEAFDLTLPSSDPMPVRFHPVFTNPVNWYDPDAGDNWVAHTIGKQEGPPPPPSSRRPRALLDAAPAWQLVPSALQPALSLPPSRSRPFVAALAESTRAGGITDAAVDSGRLRARPDVFATGHSAASLSTRETATPASSSFMTGVAATGPAMIARSRVASDPSFARSEAAPATVVMNPATPLILAQITDQLSATTTSQVVSTNSMDMSFEHCVVTLHRPWWPEGFLMTRGWFVPGYGRAELSNGKGNGDPGLLPVLSSGFVAIRNLKISARWSSDDLEAIQKAAAFGRFSLLGRTFDSQTGTLSCPGIQIIGWFCEALPILPPASDPALPATAPADSSSAPVDAPPSPPTETSMSTPADPGEAGEALP